MLDRRKLLLGFVPAAAFSSASNVASAVAEKQIAEFSPSYFSEDEWRFINAAVARLIPSDGDGPGAIETGVPEFIDRQMEAPYGHGAYYYMQGPFVTDAPPTLGFQLKYTPREMYRVGIAAVNKALLNDGGSAFTDLKVDKQDAFLKQLEKGLVSLEEIPAAAFFAQLLENTREGYLSDPQYGGNRGMAAWKWIGFPGARADFTDWIDRPGQLYPLGPAAIRGSRL
jgi:gluconate 2-dehydrogenase gamma chain